MTLEIISYREMESFGLREYNNFLYLKIVSVLVKDNGG